MIQVWGRPLTGPALEQESSPDPWWVGRSATTFGAPRPPVSTGFDYEIANVRRYLSVIHTADWLEFTWRALSSADRYRLEVRFQQGAFFSSCTEVWYDPVAGEQESEITIPDVCGADEQWTTVTISPADGKRCRGCGTFRRTDLPTNRMLMLTAVDPVEAEAIDRETAARPHQVMKIRPPESDSPRIGLSFRRH